jgi:hypothetical protein
MGPIVAVTPSTMRALSYWREWTRLADFLQSIGAPLGRVAEARAAAAEEFAEARRIAARRATAEARKVPQAYRLHWRPICTES